MAEQILRLRGGAAKTRQKTARVRSRSRSTSAARARARSRSPAPTKAGSKKGGAKRKKKKQQASRKPRLRSRVFRAIRKKWRRLILLLVGALVVVGSLFSVVSPFSPWYSRIAAARR